MSNKIKWHIESWAGRTLFDGKQFDTFQEGWDYIWENVPDDGDDETYSDFYVMESKGRSV